MCVESPLSERKLADDDGGGGDDVIGRLRDIWRAARELKSETESVRQAHAQHVTDTRQLLHASFIKMKVGGRACCSGSLAVSQSYLSTCSLNLHPCYRYRRCHHHNILTFYKLHVLLSLASLPTVTWQEDRVAAPASHAHTAR